MCSVVARAVSEPQESHQQPIAHAGRVLDGFFGGGRVVVCALC